MRILNPNDSDYPALCPWPQHSLLERMNPSAKHLDGNLTQRMCIRRSSSTLMIRVKVSQRFTPIATRTIIRCRTRTAHAQVVRESKSAPF